MYLHAPLPELCKAGVVSNHGADFKLTVDDVPVPKPGEQPVVSPLPKVIKKKNENNV